MLACYLIQGVLSVFHWERLKLLDNIFFNKLLLISINYFFIWKTVLVYGN
jgi:hypothetical protein